MYSLRVLRNSLGPFLSKIGLSCAKMKNLFSLLADFLLKKGAGGCCLGLFTLFHAKKKAL